MQTLILSGSQLAPTGSIPHGRKNIYYRETRTQNAEKGKTPQSELHLSEIITVVRKKKKKDRKKSSSSETNMFLTNTFIQQLQQKKNPQTVWTYRTMHRSIRNA